MKHVSPTAGARVLVVALAALLLGACGSSSDTSTTPAASATTTAGSAPAAAGTKVDVTEKDFSIALSQATFAAGTYTFSVKNEGSFPHNLVIEGPGVDKQKSKTVTGGNSSSVTVALQAGTYELFCGVPGHKDKGMDMKITVS
jgi:uncharacterized cupredoxin-like copper-binding protein